MKKRNRKLRLGRETLRSLDSGATRWVAGGQSGVSCLESCYGLDCLDNDDLEPGDSGGPVSTYPTVHVQTCPGVSAQVTQCATECPTERPTCNSC